MSSKKDINVKKPGVRGGLYAAELMKVTEVSKAQRDVVDARHADAVKTVKSEYPEVVNMTEQQLIEHINGNFMSQYFGPAECNIMIKNIESQRHLACKEMVASLKDNFTMDEIQRIIDAGLLSPYYSFKL